MKNVYKIFYENASLHIITDNEINGYKNSGFYEFKGTLNASEKIIPDNFLTNPNGHYIISSKDTTITLEKLKSQFIFIVAAGGIVFNENDEILTILRHGKHDLPKGKKEPNEDIPTTAIREVQEECGISNISIISPLPSTFHIYQHKSKYVLKQTYWYKMSSKKQVLSPQIEEEITKAEWTPTNDLSDFKLNTFPSLLELLKAVGL